MSQKDIKNKITVPQECEQKRLLSRDDNRSIQPVKLFFFIKRSRLCHTCGSTIAHTLYNIKTQFSTKPYSISQYEYSNRRIWIHCEKTFSLIKLLNLYPISFKNGVKNKELIGYLFYNRDYNTTKSIFTCLAKIRTCWWRQTNRK